MFRRNLLFLGVFFCSLGLMAVGCKEQVSRAAGNSIQPVSEAKSPAKPDKKKVARIVVIGQKEACKCTRDRINASWRALQSANSTSPQVPVERLQWDVDEEAAGKYLDIKALIVLPGIYFLDKKGALIEMLQGQVREEKIYELLH